MLIDYFSMYIGFSIEFKIVKDIFIFEVNLVKGVYDIVYMNFYYFVVFNEMVGYCVFVY